MTMRHAPITMAYSKLPAIHRWNRSWTNCCGNWISKIRCGNCQGTAHSIRLPFPLEPKMDTSSFCQHWMNGVLGIARARACLWYRAPFTIPHLRIATRSIRKIFAKSKLTLPLTFYWISNWIMLCVSQMDYFAKANGLGAVPVVDSSSLECCTHCWGGQRGCIADIRFRHDGHCCQVHLIASWSPVLNQTKSFYDFDCSTLAAFGLVENSMILLVSSMLISPLMGPIIATTFGIVIEDRALIRFGWANEMFGVMLATTVGFFFGLIVYSLDLYSHVDGNGLITNEMLSRLVSMELTQLIDFHDLIRILSSQMRSAFAHRGYFNGITVGCGRCHRYTRRKYRIIGWRCDFCVDFTASSQYGNFAFSLLGFTRHSHHFIFAGYFLVNVRFALTQCDRRWNCDQIELLFGPSIDRTSHSRSVEHAADCCEHCLHSLHGRSRAEGESLRHIFLLDSNAFSFRSKRSHR